METREFKGRSWREMRGGNYEARRDVCGVKCVAGSAAGNQATSQKMRHKTEGWIGSVENGVKMVVRK